MTKLAAILCVLLISVFWTFGSSAHESTWVDGQNPKSPFMRSYGQALAPIGHVSFCRLHEGECAGATGQNQGRRIALTDKRRQDLSEVNALVNQMVRPVSDQALYGRLEHWTYPADEGDCEDFVLLKRRMLLQRSWPASALLITVVRDENGEGHAILTVRTADGDFILDNRNQDVLIWNQSSYQFVKRQSFHDPQIWVSLMPPGIAPPLQMSGTKSR